MRSSTTGEAYLSNRRQYSMWCDHDLQTAYELPSGEDLLLDDRLIVSPRDVPTPAVSSLRSSGLAIPGESSAADHLHRPS